MRINPFAAALAVGAIFLAPLAVSRQRRLTAERKARKLAVEKETNDLLESAEAMLNLIATTLSVGQRMAPRAECEKLKRLRDLGFMFKRMAMPDFALQYAREAQAQVKNILAIMGSGNASRRRA